MLISCSQYNQHRKVYEFTVSLTLVEKVKSEKKVTFKCEIFPSVIFFPRAPHNCFLNTWSISKTICHSPSELLHFSELKNLHSPPTWAFNQFNQSAFLLDRQVFGRQEHKTSPINAAHSLSYLSVEQFSFAHGILTTFAYNLIIILPFCFLYRYKLIFVVFVKTMYHIWIKLQKGTKPSEELFLVGLKIVFLSGIFPLWQHLQFSNTQKHFSSLNLNF